VLVYVVRKLKHRVRGLTYRHFPRGMIW